jgi:hypothetical protein
MWDVRSGLSDGSAAQVSHFRDEQIGDTIEAALADHQIFETIDDAMGEELSRASTEPTSARASNEVAVEPSWDYEQVADIIEVDIRDQKDRNMIDRASRNHNVRDMIDAALIPVSFQGSNLGRTFFAKKFPPDFTSLKTHWYERRKGEGGHGRGGQA